MSLTTRDDPFGVHRAGPRNAVLVGSVVVVGAFWAAPLAGLSITATALVATSTFAVLVAILLRELDRRVRRRAVASETLRALKSSEARFKLLADHSADIIVETDRDLVRRFVSPSSMAVLGYTPDELVGTAALDIVHPDDLASYRRSLATLLDGTRDRIVTTQRYRRKDGAYVWAEGHIQVTRDPVTGDPSGYVGSLRDITERHVAAAAVRDSEAFLRGVIDASPDCIKVLDLDGQVSFMSRNGLCLLDIEDGDDPIGRDFATLWPIAVRADVEAAVSAAGSGAASRFRARRVSAKGHSLHLDVVIAPIVSAGGGPERLLAISRDVTASAHAEAELRTIQDRYRLLAENSSDVVMLRAPGADGRALYVSPSAARVLGYSPERVKDIHHMDIVHPDDRAALRAVLEGLGPATGFARHTHRIRRADDSVIWVEGAFQMAERAGEPVVVVALRDVTDRQQRAEDIAAARDLAERAQRNAEQASEAKSDFLAAMSHEIRTPLNSIIGFTDLMLDAGDLPQQAQRHAELIRASGAALLTVVNDILDFSKIEAGAVELEAIPFSPMALAQHSAAILRGYAGTKALDIDVELGERLPAFLLGDEARIRQVLLNFLNNAVKFTPRGRVTLRVMSLDSQTAAGPADHCETVRFEVMDTGIGIPDAKQHRLFERFSQVDSSVARRFGGSGLGLAICKKLVALMGGTIGVSSREGEGSTFWFTVTLPRAVAAMPVHLPGPAIGSGRSARILVVEDIDINQRLAIALLEAVGHDVDVVGEGALAVAAVAAKAYDLVFMDVQMPGMDGVTATRLIRESDGPNGQVPIVAMTANVFPEQVKVFRDAGMNDHVGKPLNRGQLYAAVKRWATPADPPGVPSTASETVAGSSPEVVARDFDEGTYGLLKEYLGPERLDDVLLRFAASLPNRFAPGEPTPDTMRRWNADAHVVLSVAGMTGFVDLARHCRSLESAVPGSDHHAACLTALRASRDVTIRHLSRLREALAGPAHGDTAAEENAA